MSHAEVLRRHEQLTHKQQDVLEELRTRHKLLTRGVIMADGGQVLILAKPLGAPRQMLNPLASVSGWQSVLVEILRKAMVSGHHNFGPSFGAPGQGRRPNGIALTTGMQPGDVFSGGSRQAELVLFESGDLLLQSGRAVVLDVDGANRYGFEELIAGHTDVLVRFAAEVSGRYTFARSWHFGLLATRLAGGNSGLLRSNMVNPGYRFADDTYEAATTATPLEIQRSPEAIVEELVSGLLRSLGSHGVLPLLQPADRNQ